MDDGSEGCSALEMPYQGGHLSMVFLLPTNDFGLADLEKQLNREKLSSILSRLKQKKAEIFLPKFEMTCSYSMKDSLSQMGMAAAFDIERADFGKLSKDPEKLFISDVVHKAFIKVDEAGTEAAAAMAVMMMAGCAFTDAPTPKFVVDHPFLFLIKDSRVQNSVLFAGRAFYPSSS